MHTAIVDSALTFDEAVVGLEFPAEIRIELTLLDVLYEGFDARAHQGQLVVHRDLAEEVAAIFAEIHAARFPIAQVVPVVRFGWSDDASMAANNSSAFNYRIIHGSDTLSQHSYGRAIDINPLFNPYIKGTLVLPAGARYEPSRAGTVVDGGVVARAFEERGWTWGGRWTSRQDWQHFEKRYSGESS